MDNPSRTPRLALVVNPRLLGETLARALRAEGLEVVLAADDQTLDDGIDIAIVSDPPSDWVDVPVIIRLPAPCDGGVGTVTRRGHASQAVPLHDVRSVLATLRDDGLAGR